MSIEFAQRLIDAGIPVIVCTSNPKWPGKRPDGTDELELFPRKGWQTMRADESDLSGFRPGVDTLAMVGGHGIDVIDVDPKNGGSVDNLPPFKAFGVTRTPSGGTHHYVRSTGDGKMALKTPLGVVGDYVGGTPMGGGRLLAFLPGSTRPKYPGLTYTLEQDLELEALLESEPDDNLIAALIGAGGRRGGQAGKPAVRLAEVDAFLAEHSEITEPCGYGRAAMQKILESAGSVVDGDPVHGRHMWAIRSATRVVELMRAGCATSMDLVDVEQTLHRIKPEGGTDWWAVLGWALANADGTVNCSQHGTVAEYVTSLAADDLEPAVARATAQNETAQRVGQFESNEARDVEAAQLDAAAAFARDRDIEAYRIRVREAARQKVQEEKNAVTVLPPLVGLRDFLNVPDEPITHRIAGLWPSGGRVVVNAQHKAGKSTLSANVLRSLADGVPFLDTFTVTATKRILLLDNELDENMLRRWLRDQGVTNSDAIELVALRGKLSTFDILDPEIRSRWAKHLGPADVLVFDCLRPALDALRLKEDKDAGIFLEALDELTAEAGISETLLVHHMGHAAERSRGDSRILDWPDAVWKIIKDAEDDEDGADESVATVRRYFSAYGRDVDQPEALLTYDAETRRLAIGGGGRKFARAERLTATVLAFITAHPGCSKNAIEKGVEGKAEHVRRAVKLLASDGRINVEKGSRGHLHTATSSTSSHLVPDEGDEPLVRPRPLVYRTRTRTNDESGDVISSETRDEDEPSKPICSVCSTTMAFDDGTGTHPTCEVAS